MKTTKIPTLDSLIEGIEKEFDDKWNYHGKFQNGEAFPNVKSFLRSSLLSLLEKVKEDVEGEKRKIGHILPCKECSPSCGFNSALSKVSQNLSDAIKQMK